MVIQRDDLFRWKRIFERASPWASEPDLENSNRLLTVHEKCEAGQGSSENEEAKKSQRWTDP